MVSPGAREQIVRALDIDANDVVWEIGPGIGSITALLRDRCKSLTVFEIDHGLIRVLTRRFGETVRIVPGDAVATIPKTFSDGCPDLIVGNLPYRSAATIVASVLEAPSRDRVRRLVFTVQREVARRMTSEPGSRDYSALSVLCALSGRVTIISDLAAGSFYPVPDVVSSIVGIDLGDAPPRLVARAGLCARALFSSRRKTIRNNLAHLTRATGIDGTFLSEALGICNIDPSSRAETINPDQFLCLASRTFD